MIPSDIKITPLSGSGDSSVSMTMEEYTGRVAKPTREVWVYDTEDTVSDMVEVDQYPKTEFIGLNDPLTFSVAALGGEVTVTGTSNSSALKPVEFGEALKFELSINGEVQSSWSPDNPIITGDIGADKEYSFSLKVTVPENQTTSQKPWTFQLSNNAQIVTATITINQAAGVRTYSDITISEFSYPVASAAGGMLTPTLSYSQTWGWNGQTTGGGTITSGAALSYEAIEGWHQSVLDPATGIITAPSRGTVIAIQQTEFTAKVNVSLNGKTASLEADVTQAKNVPVSGTTTSAQFAINSGTNPIPASGGTVNFVGRGNANITWSSGATGAIQTNGTAGYSVVVHRSYLDVSVNTGFTLTGASMTAEDRGTVVGAARNAGVIKGELNYTINIDNEYGGGTFDTTFASWECPENFVTQEANVATYGDVIVAATTPVSLAAAGTTYDLKVEVTASQTLTFTSGDTKAGDIDFTYTQKTVATGFSLSNGVVTVTENPGATQRGGYVVTVKADGEGSKTASKDITFNQQGSESYITVSPETLIFEAAGGTQTITISSNDSWTIS